MKQGWVWALGLGLAALGGPVQAAARDAVQLQTPLDGAGAALHETSLGDLVADAVRQAAGADIALVAADEITEASIPAGSVPPQRIIKTLRYADDPSDTVVVLKLTGTQLLKVAERSVSRAPQPFDGFLQVSGLELRFDAGQPEGKRVHLTVAGVPVRADQSYRVAVTRPLADGGFGYFRFWNKSDVEGGSFPPLAAALGAYLAAHKTLHVQTENRIVGG